MSGWRGVRAANAGMVMVLRCHDEVVNGDGAVRGRRWIAPSVTGAVAVVGVLLGLSTNVASSLISPDWAQQHAVWVWSGTGLLAVVTVVLTVVAARAPSQASSPAEAVCVTGSPHTVVTGGSSVDRSVNVGSVPGGGVVVVAQDGARVEVGAVQAGPAPEAGAGQIVVGELPGVPPAFVARAEVEQLEAVLGDGARLAVVCALTGGRGAGKTQVAAAYARAQVQAGCSLVAWVSGQDSDRLLSGLAEVAAALGVADPDGDSRRSAARLRDALQTRTSGGLLVIDNAEDPATVREFLPAVGSVQVVVTSTDRAFTALGQAVEIGVFERGESVAYLRQRTGLPDVSEACDDALEAGGGQPGAGAEQVAEALGDLPLALAQAASVITARGLSYEGYLQRWSDQPVETVLPPDRGDAYPRGAAAAILLSLDAARTDPIRDSELRAEDRERYARAVDAVLMAVALLAGEGSERDLVAQVAATLAAAHDLPAVDSPFDSTTGEQERGGGSDVDEVIGHLVAASLLTWTHGRSVLMHRLVARTVRDRAETTADLGQHIVATARVLTQLSPPEAEAWSQRQRATAIVDHTIHLWAVSIAAHRRSGISTADLSAVAPQAIWAVRHLTATADLSRAITLGSTILADCERVLGADHPHTITTRNNLAYAYQSAGDLGRAIELFEATLTEQERVLGADHPNTLTLRNNLAYAYRSAGDLGRAIPLFEATLTDCERVLGDKHPFTRAVRGNLSDATSAAGGEERDLSG